MRRASTSSEEPLLKSDLAKRGLRQKARDVISDLGAPPTKRQDEKEGRRVKKTGYVMTPVKI